jgi:class 3 adenylate cyclase/predicted ATPase
MRCSHCQTLNPPAAKFCLECGNRLGSCLSCGTINPAGAKFCIECGTILSPSSGTKTPPVADASASEPKERQTQSTPAKTAIPSIQTSLSAVEERRIVTIMFADITGSTPLADRLDPEDMRAILTGYFNLMTKQIRKHDGTVEKYIGDAVMAVFGAPITHEDDPDRAIRAALDMQAALRLFNEQRLARDPEATRLQMRIGINTGEVAAPSTTATQFHDFLITGDAVNIAARLQQMATPDTLLVGERTYLSSREVFEFQAIAPLQVKGKAEPIAAYVALGLRQATTTITQHPRGLTGGSTQIVGRNLELTLLHASYARVQTERRPHLITILGAPGIGKSRLVREFITREQELIKSASPMGEIIPPLILQGRCPPYGEGITYWPLIEILRTILHVQYDDTHETVQQRFTDFLRVTFARSGSSASATEIAEILWRSIGNGLISKKTPIQVSNETELTRSETSIPVRSATTQQSNAQGALSRAWRVLLEALGERQPLIIVVDDLQWADEALLDLFEYLTDRITAVPVFVICPARPDFLEQHHDWGGGHRNFTAIELEALTQNESSDLINALLNTSELPEALRYTILTRSEGNPFFVEEIVRMFIDQGILVQGENRERGQSFWHIDNDTYSVMGEFGQSIQTADFVTEETDEDDLLLDPYLIPLPYVPDTIQGVLAARVDLLNPLDKQILQHGSIIGRIFWLSALQELITDLHPDTLENALLSLSQHDFIVEIQMRASGSPITPDRAFAFTHILIRDVVYNNIPRQRRAREHAHMALWLEEKIADQQSSFIEMIAYHLQRALSTWSTNATLDVIEIKKQRLSTTPTILLTRNDLRARTVKFLTLTGDQALDNYYSLRALRAYTDAIDLLDESHADALTRSKMLTKIGEAHAQRGNLDSAWRSIRRALQLVLPTEETTDHNYLLKLYNLLALFATRWLPLFDAPLDQREVRTYIDRGLKLLQEKTQSEEHVAFLTYLVFWYIDQLGKASSDKKNELAEQALHSGTQALQIAEELNNPRTLSPTLDAMSVIYIEVYRSYTKAREIQERRRQLEPLISSREELYDLYMSQGYTYLLVAEYATALTYYGQAWNNALKMESPPMVLSSMTGRMTTWYSWNRWDEAQKIALEILQFIEKYQQDEQRQLWAIETLASIAYHRGNQEEGNKYAQQYKRLLDQKSETLATEAMPNLDTKLHDIHLAQEDWPRALENYRDKFLRSEPFPSPEILSTYIELLVINDQADKHEALFDRAVTLCEDAGAHKSLAAALRARGRLYTQKGQWEQAEEDLLRSHHYCTTLDLPWENAHSLYQLALLHQDRANKNPVENCKNDGDLMRYYLEQALGFYTFLHAKPFVTRIREILETK